MKVTVMDKLTDYVNQNNLKISNITVSVGSDNSINPSVVNVKFEQPVTHKILPFVLTFNCDDCSTITVYGVGPIKHTCECETVYIPGLYTIESMDDFPECVKNVCSSDLSIEVIFDYYTRIVKVAHMLYDDKYYILGLGDNNV